MVIFWGLPAPLLAVPHPTCLPYIRRTEETLFQAQTAIKTAEEQLRKLQKRAKVMEVLASEGAISRRQRDRVREQVSQSKQEIADHRMIVTQAQGQIKTLNATSQCTVKS